MRERANLDAFRPTMFIAPAPARSSSVRGASFRSMSKIRGAMGYALSMRQLCSPENRRTDDYLLHPLRDRSVPARKLQRVRRELGPIIPRCGGHLVGVFPTLRRNEHDCVGFDCIR